MSRKTAKQINIATPIRHNQWGELPFEVLSGIKSQIPSMLDFNRMDQIGFQPVYQAGQLQ
jgi:hypothetical protein